MYIVICIQLDRKEMNPILLEAIYQDYTSDLILNNKGKQIKKENP